MEKVMIFEITNYQSHTKTVLEFIPGINVIVGDSDSGKSALFRAISSLIYKTPFYLRYGQTRGTVKATFPDYWVSRTFAVGKITKCPSCKEPITSDICKCGEVLSAKTSEDFYEDSQSEKPYEKFGVKLPDFLTKRIKIFPILFVDLEVYLNLTRQHADMFFIGESWSGGERSKVLSALIPDSEKVDVSIKKLNADTTSLKQEIDYLTQVNADINDKLTKIDPDIEEVKKLIKRKAELEQEVASLSKSIKELKNIAGKLKQCEVGVKIKDAVSKLSSAVVTAKAKFTFVEGLFEKKERLEEIARKLAKIPNIEDVPEQPEYNKNVVNDLALIYMRSDKITNLRNEIYLKDRDIKKNKEEKEKLTIEIAKLKKEASEVLQEECCPITGDKYCKECPDKIQRKLDDATDS